MDDQSTGKTLDSRLAEFARSKTAGPAISLIIVSTIAWVSLLPFFAHGIWLLATGQADSLSTGIFSTAVRTAWNGLMQLSCLTIICGAVSMKRLKRERLARTACLLAMIPCVGPVFILGIPFGIWGLIVLRNEKVKLAF